MNERFSKMEVVILAGGKGTRLHDMTKDIIPKPMVMLDKMPIFWHILQIYYLQGFRRFIIAAGHRQDVFASWLDSFSPPQGAEITLVDTGEETETGGRLRRLAAEGYLQETFMMTYGDGLGNVNMGALFEWHEDNRAIVTLTAVHPPARFGALEIAEDGGVVEFGEKRQLATEWVNGGFYVCETGLIERIPDDSTSLEFDVLPELAAEGRLHAYQHSAFWQMMDAPRDFQLLEEMAVHSAPWMEGVESYE